MVQNRYARLAPGLFFAVYLLAFLLIEFAVNDNAALLFGAKSVNGIYSAGLCCTALGYLAFPLLRRLTKGERARLLVLTLICLLLVASVVPLMLAPRPFFLPCAFLSLLCAGYIGGMAHYFLALALQNSRCTGRVIGFAIAGESLLQFFIQSYLETAPLLIASVAVCVAAIFFIVRFPPGDWVLDNPLPYGEGGVPPGRKLAVAGATVCLMSVIVSLDDTIARLPARGGQRRPHGRRAPVLRRGSPAVRLRRGHQKAGLPPFHGGLRARRLHADVRLSRQPGDLFYKRRAALHTLRLERRLSHRRLPGTSRRGRRTRSSGRAWGASCAPSPSRRRRCPSSGFTTRRGTR